jgi:hypothetical protein
MKTALALVPLLIITVSNFAHGDTFGSGANSFDIEFVTIGNPGNTADTTGNPNPVGSVPYVYNIGKYEISRGMITKVNNLAFLNLTMTDMTSYGGNGVNRPATGMCANYAARFVNWLNVTTGSPPAYKFAVQPGAPGYSAQTNDIQLWTPSDAGYNPNNLYRNSLAHYFLPSDDEWYKAAYYDPNSGVYYDYATGSDVAPTSVTNGTAAGTAVYNRGLNVGPADVTRAGGLSPYGTMGQGGNASELVETDYDLVNDGVSSIAGFPGRGTRGGYWGNTFDYLSASTRLSNGANNPNNIGTDFRVASTFVPEPSSAVLSLSVLAFLASRRHRR